jgi:hypothetical protein
VGRNEALRDVGEARAAGSLCGRHPEDLDEARLVVAQVEHALKERGFAGAVGAHQPHGGPRRDLQIDARQRALRAVMLQQS